MKRPSEIESNVLDTIKETHGITNIGVALGLSPEGGIVKSALERLLETRNRNPEHQVAIGSIKV